MQLFYDMYFLRLLPWTHSPLGRRTEINQDCKRFFKKLYIFLSSSYKCQAIEIKQMITSFAIHVWYIKPHLHIMIQF